MARQFIDERGVTLVEGDVNGDGRADFAIKTAGPIMPDAGDFVL
ncbi:hypothetical protein [Ensifer soli]